MRARTAWLRVALVVLALASSAAAAAADAADGEGERGVRKLGRYELRSGASGLEVRPPSGGGFTRFLGVGGGIGVAVGLLLLSRPRARGPAILALAVGAALLVGSGVARLQDVAWRIGHDGLEREDALGRITRWSAEQIASVELRPRQLTGPEAKQGRPTPWIVGVRGTDGTLLARFFFRSRPEALSLASRIVALTGRPLEESETPTR